MLVKKKKKKNMLTKFKLFESILNESSFFDLSINNFFNDKFLNDFKKQESDFIRNELENYISDNDLDDNNESEIEDSTEFNEYIEDILKDNFIEFKETIYDIIDDNTDKIKIYRSIRVDDNWLNHLKTQGKRLGIYWSWDYDGAESHWGDFNKKNEVVIESEINEKYINWEETIYQNIHPNYQEEKEIRLFKNTPIIIKSIQFNDNSNDDGNKEIDITEIKNKIFYA